MEHSLSNQELRQWYAERGFGGRVGFGERPALLVIDVAHVWLDPNTQLGSSQEAMLDNVLKVLARARQADIPIVFTTMGYSPNMRDAGKNYVKKLPHARSQVRDAPQTQVHPALERRPSELLIVKPRASAFFGTNLLSFLIGQTVDTVIVVGVSTSGCIRGTCESAFNYDFRVIVPQEAVGDRSQSAHEANLFDIDNRYADVVPVNDVLSYLASLQPTVAATS